MPARRTISGNLLYDIQPAEAIRQWERSRELDPGFPMAGRNLALAYARREKDVKKAVPVLEAAVAQDQNPRFIAESIRCTKLPDSPRQSGWRSSTNMSPQCGNATMSWLVRSFC